MMPDWLAVMPLGEVIAWCGAIVAFGLAVWKGWPIFKRLVALLAASIKLVDTLATLPDDLAAIRHELEHNGGGSVKDSVIRTEKAVAELTGKVDHVQRQGASLKTTLAKTNRRLNDHIDSVTSNAA